MTVLKRTMSALASLARINRELTGCDWCCGGGNELRTELERIIAKDKAPIPRRCTACDYYDSHGDSGLCEKCTFSFREDPEPELYGYCD